MAESLVVGVDIGGTNIVAAMIDSRDAEVVSRRTIPTEAQRGPLDGFDRLGNLIESIIQEAGLTIGQMRGIGVGCTGPVDSIKGRVNNPYTLPTWDDAPLVEHLTERFKLPVVLLNDAHAAALGEHWAGSGRGTQHMIYITVGTGIGSGIILNGRLHRGVGLMAGEIGHQVIDINGPDCYCGARGCLEMLAAGPAIVRIAAERAAPDGALLRLVDHDRSRITAQAVYEAAVEGDSTALGILQQTGFYLGVGVANLLNTLAPEVVILGGGVMLGWSLIAPTMLETIRQRDSMVPFSQTRIVPASLKLNAGVIGAARGLLDSLDG